MNWAPRIAALSASLIVASGIAVGAIDVPGAGASAIALARIVALTLGVAGIPVSLDGAVIDADGFVAVVVAQCTAIEIILVYSAAVLVAPVQFRARMWALALGIPVLCTLNLVRLVSLLLVGIGFPERFDVMHLVVWQVVMAVAGFTMWLFWLMRSYANERLEGRVNLKGNS